MEVMRAIPIDSAPSSRSRRDIRDISASITSITSARDLTDLVIRDMLEGSVFFAADKEPTCLPSFQPNGEWTTRLDMVEPSEYCVFFKFADTSVSPPR
jgi:hypothetical protein